MPTAMLPSSAREKVLDSKMAVAQDLEHKKELEKAKKTYESIHKADPDRALACHRLAIVSYRLGERDESLEYFEKAKELTPENAELLSDYGYALYKMKKYPEAEDVLRKSVSLSPKSERATTRLATVLGSQGKMQESYTQLCKISSPAEAHEIIAHLHAERGEKQLALTHYQKSLAMSQRDASGRGSIKQGSKEFEQNQKLLKRVEQNIAQLSADPALKSSPDTRMVSHSQKSQTKPEMQTAGLEKDMFRKVNRTNTTKPEVKSQESQPKTEVAEVKDSPFRAIRDRFLKDNDASSGENPFLADPMLAESAFDEPEVEVASTKPEQKQVVEVEKIMAEVQSQPEPQENVSFRKLTDEDVNRLKGAAAIEKKTVAVAAATEQVAKVASPEQNQTKTKRSAFELMRELQNELISDFTPPQQESPAPQPEYRLVQQTEPQYEERNPFENASHTTTVTSPFEGSEVTRIGKWNPLDPDSIKTAESGKINTLSQQIESRPVTQNQKLVVQTASVSQPKKQDLIQPNTAEALCPDAQGEVLSLVRELNSNQVPELKQAIQRLGAMEAEAAAAVPALRSLSLHENMGVRIQCAFSLWKIAGNTDDSVPTLMDAMNSSVESDRSFAAAVLAQIGVHSQELTPILVRSLSDNNEYVRLHTAELLARDSEWKYQANKTLADCLLSKDVNIRWLASYSLADLKPEDDHVIAVLSIALQDKASQVRAGAAYALGEIGPYAHKSIPELQKARFDTNSEVRTAAKNALSRVRRVTPPSAN
ncbi:tetratricopeptide repeat protein [Gimesia sp.]|uniref:HEAT repeat domain-containing protein n=1 Tax=Gimesia sp. TaxID=2024833 RepID=UPI0025C18FD8|nr:tetratricopeptide repeat protein [Gimesia sp.]|tara:strand:- start:3584 stop:5881 length:2298 start_codon:yes stop_codon:yes gene_type:complete